MTVSGGLLKLVAQKSEPAAGVFGSVDGQEAYESVAVFSFVMLSIESRAPEKYILQAALVA